jgi:hypothetical protein
VRKRIGDEVEVVDQHLQPIEHAVEDVIKPIELVARARSLDPSIQLPLRDLRGDGGDGLHPSANEIDEHDAFDQRYRKHQEQRAENGFEQGAVGENLHDIDGSDEQAAPVGHADCVDVGGFGVGVAATFDRGHAVLGRNSEARRPLFDVPSDDVACRIDQQIGGLSDPPSHEPLVDRRLESRTAAPSVANDQILVANTEVRPDMIAENDVGLEVGEQKHRQDADERHEPVHQDEAPRRRKLVKRVEEALQSRSPRM